MVNIYLYDKRGLLIAEQVALVNEHGKVMLPDNATFSAPLPQKEGYEVIYNGEKWIYEQIAKAEEQESPYHPLNYIEQRLRAYPDYGEQLDMIYWDKVNGTNNWPEKISEIKAKYPKVDLNA